MDYINVAIIENYTKPIAASHSWNTLLDLMDDYFGPESKRLGWYVSNPDEYVGYFEYRDYDGEVVKVKIYEVDFK